VAETIDRQAAEHGGFYDQTIFCDPLKPRPQSWGCFLGEPAANKLTDLNTTIPSLFQRIWPIAVIVLSMIAAVTWTGIIGYAVYRLGAWAF